MDQKQDIIRKILKSEWKMFSSVNDSAKADPLTQNQPSCKDFPDEFKIHRTAQLMAWSTITLTSYLNDLNLAEKSAINLMTYKYARMDNLISCENQSPFIDKIASTMVAWQKEFIQRYPGLMSKGRRLSGEEPGKDWASFETYLRCELETYSEKTLELLFADTQTYISQEKSFSDVVYTYLSKAKGYRSLDDAEKRSSI